MGGGRFVPWHIKETALTHISLPVFWLGSFFFCVPRLSVCRLCVSATSSQKPQQCKECSEAVLISQLPYAAMVHEKSSVSRETLLS